MRILAIKISLLAAEQCQVQHSHTVNDGPAVVGRFCKAVVGTWAENGLVCCQGGERKCKPASSPWWRLIGAGLGSGPGQGSKEALPPILFRPPAGAGGLPESWASPSP